MIKTLALWECRQKGKLRYKYLYYVGNGRSFGNGNSARVQWFFLCQNFALPAPGRGFPEDFVTELHH